MGTINWDTVVFERSFPAPGEEVPVLRLEGYPGGKGANTAVGAARILGAGKVAFIGAVGNDAKGSRLVEGLRRDGVDVAGVAVLGGSKTGEAVVIVDGLGRKTIHTSFGANDGFAPALLSTPRVSAPLSVAKTVVIMDVPLSTARSAARSARMRGARVVYSPCIRSGLGAVALGSVIQQVDDLVLDVRELSKLCRTDGIKPALRLLHDEFPRLTVVVTRGASGSTVVDSEGRADIPPVDLRSLGLQAVNATGAGDAFLAAYICYSLAGHTPREAARWGNLGGALKASSEESRGSPDGRALEATMRKLQAVRRSRLGSPSRRASSRSRRRS